MTDGKYIHFHNQIVYNFSMSTNIPINSITEPTAEIAEMKAPWRRTMVVLAISEGIVGMVISSSAPILPAYFRYYVAVAKNLNYAATTQSSMMLVSITIQLSILTVAFVYQYRHIDNPALHDLATPLPFAIESVSPVLL